MSGLPSAAARRTSPRRRRRNRSPAPNVSSDTERTSSIVTWRAAATGTTSRHPATPAQCVGFARAALSLSRTPHTAISIATCANAMTTPRRPVAAYSECSSTRPAPARRSRPAHASRRRQPAGRLHTRRGRQHASPAPLYRGGPNQATSGHRPALPTPCHHRHRGPLQALRPTRAHNLGRPAGRPSTRPGHLCAPRPRRLPPALSWPTKTPDPAPPRAAPPVRQRTDRARARQRRGPRQPLLRSQLRQRRLVRQGRPPPWTSGLDCTKAPQSLSSVRVGHKLHAPRHSRACRLRARPVNCSRASRARVRPTRPHGGGIPPARHPGRRQGREPHRRPRRQRAGLRWGRSRARLLARPRLRPWIWRRYGASRVAPQARPRQTRQ